MLGGRAKHDWQPNDVVECWSFDVVARPLARRLRHPQRFRFLTQPHFQLKQ
jgi:hypothetical protein